ncbi:CoB--CoM heterodisulfide reductase iron-sulfur subunit A family protein, partial [bacterium]|nr:CoB--CoM heterodisulfide reductase iron-sulfur subunit A family protein [bacterium]
KSKSVIVVGGGVAGIQAALDLADMGADVHLIEQSPSIGGRMAQLDKTFPTNDCSLCILSPKMSECSRHPGIKIHTCSDLLAVSGEPGDFKVKILERAKYVDTTKCVACGICEEKCPVKVDDVFDTQLRKRKAIYRYFLQSVPSNFVIDEEHCLYLNKGACRLCEKECPADAINFDDTDRIVEQSAGAIILSTGIDAFNPIGYAQFGYGKFKDVYTSLEFERLLCASGPHRGHVVTRSTGKEPRKIAFLQCIGSRDVDCGKDYCSAVCCMYAIKEAIIAKEHIKTLEPTIFFMDIRAYGKEFDKYYYRAEKQFGVKFVRAKVAKITQVSNDPQSDDYGKLRVHFTQPNGKHDSEDFDMISLSVGLEARKDLEPLADKLDIKLDQYGFCRTDLFNPLNTSREGIFVCGPMSGPKDIPESVMSASGAVGRCARLLGLERQEKVSKKEFPPEKDVIGNRPRIGAFICHCGINIAGVVDVKQVAEFAKTLPNVEYADTLLYACSQDCMDDIKDKIEKYKLNRILVAACTPRTHEPLFRETLREAGLNQYLFEMANIRDQCSWAHMNEPELATLKSKELVAMGVAKAHDLVPLERLPIPINPNALVIGGGIAGMTAALAFAESGFQTYLVEREGELGGHLRTTFFTLEGENPQKLLKDTIKKVKAHKLIEVYSDSEIKTIKGYVGNFKTNIQSGNKDPIEVEHGIVVVATGGNEHKTSSYLYGENRNVLTQKEFERMMTQEDFKNHHLRNVVMIQCVDSREPEEYTSCEGDRLYCSRVCCSHAIKNSLVLKGKKPKTDIFVLYRDVRTYGLREKFYGEARDKEVIFIQYDLDRKPDVKPLDPEDPNSKLLVTVFDPILDKKVQIEADLLVLSVGIDPPAQNENLGKMLKVPLNKEGFFLEAHMKLRPVDFATEGIFMAGLAHCPKSIDESIIQANAAASRAMTILSKMVIEAEGTICHVNPEKCTACGTCVEVCAYAATSINEETGVAEINDALCKGCGACAASCRCGAIDLRGFTDQQIYQAITSLE